ncbi:MAG: LuxR family transcriptional regulator [Solirubrobacterales bacterium]|nr:LuxR family transcriptional regulator [Solirubrobacterales bacterium]
MTVASSRVGVPFPPAAPRSGWRRRGAELTNRVAEILVSAQELLGPELAIGQIRDLSAGRSAEVVSTLTWLCIDRLREEQPSKAKTAAICTLVSDLQKLALELYENEMASRTRRLAAMEDSLNRLRAMSTSADLLDHVCEELVRNCGFERALLSRVENGIWTPWVPYFTETATMQRWFEDWLDTAIPLNEMVLENQLLTECRPELVDDTSIDKVHPIVRAGLSNSYVVAPVMPAGNVVGFLHADHHPTDRRCDETDRDVLWAFAEGFGHIYERTVLLERLRSQRDEVRETLGAVDEAMVELTESEIQLATKADNVSTVKRAAVSVLTTMSDDIGELTPRELEVLELMVAGATNSEIANKLVITEGTVKSHVKHILRKLGAVNRSQAIAHYLGVSGDHVV